MSLISFIIGLLLGAGQVGASTWRTIQVYEGKVFSTLFTSAILAVTFWTGTKYVVANDIVGYSGFALGGAIICLLMALYEKRFHHGINRTSDSEKSV